MEYRIEIMDREFLDRTAERLRIIAHPVRPMRYTISRSIFCRGRLLVYAISHETRPASI